MAIKHWEIIADNLSKAGWSWGCVAAIDSRGRTIWIADAHLPIAGDKNGYPKGLPSVQGSWRPARIS